MPTKTKEATKTKTKAADMPAMSGQVVNYEEKTKEIVTDISNIIKKARTLKVESQEDMEKASEYLGTIKGRIKRLEEVQEFFTGAMKRELKEKTAFFKGQIDPLKQELDALKYRCSAFIRAQEHARLAEEERLLKIRQAADAKREEKGQAPIMTPVKTVEAAPTTTVATSGKTTARKVWKFQIEEHTKIPGYIVSEVMALALEKGLYDQVIRRHVMAGTREIPGVKIYEDFEMAVSAFN